MPEPLRSMGKQTKLAYGLAMVVVQEQKRLCGSQELRPIARFGSNLQVVAKSSMFVALEHVIHRALLCRQTRHALCALESCVVRRDTAYPATAWDALRQPTYLGRPSIHHSLTVHGTLLFVGEYAQLSHGHNTEQRSKTRMTQAKFRAGSLPDFEDVSLRVLRG
ncbi:hypothetical protein C8R45DRAFT_1084569 [Mycena sanguinolenta]|nr:hypothetical protein C8R45DRAFT_1084569 [Mycena sanguinolenta]